MSDKSPKTYHLVRTLTSLSQQKKGTAIDPYQQLQLLIATRAAFKKRVISFRLEKLKEKNLVMAIEKLFDRAILDIYKRTEIKKIKNTDREQSLIYDLKIVKNDLQKQLNSTYQIIKNLPIGLAGCDSDLNVILWNPAAVNITGYRQTDIFGQNVLKIFSIPSQKVVKSQLSREGNRLKRMKLNIQTKDGGKFSAYVSINSLPAEVKQKIYYIINFVDVSKDEKLQAQIEKIEQLSAIARLSDAIMHDIRNPINSLALNIDVLTQILVEKSSADKDLINIIEKINRQISNLTENLNRYIGYSRITELQLEILDIREPINELILDMRQQISGKEININYHRPDKKLMIRGDWYQLVRVFRNLMENAIDAIENTGKIDVFVRKKNKNINIIINDDGQGINSENLEHIFKPYFTDKEKGTGLGLFIVREIVRAHGGKIYCSSKEDHGSRFTISLPAKID